MDSPSVDWNHLRALLATAQHGSLSAAARALGLTQPTLSRQIAALEDRLGLMIFERNGRTLSLTEAGAELIHHARDMGAAADRLTLAAEGQRSDLSGLVRITASDVASAFMLPQVVKDIRIRAPQISVEIVASNTIEDLMKREADIAIRHVRPEQPNLVARLICEKTGHFFAATSYLEAKGRPQNLADLTDHDWISPGDVSQMLGYMKGMSVPVEADNFRTISENGVAAWEMCKAGLGITPMDDSVGATAPQLERILPDLLEVTYPVWLVTHREIHTSPRIRLVYDLLAEALPKPLA